MSELPPSWEWTTIGDLVGVTYGKGLSARDRDSSGSVPVIGSAGVAGTHSSALVEVPAIVVGRKGNAGAVWPIDGPSWPIDTTYYVRPPGGVSLRFLAHQLDFLRLGELDSSTAIPSLRRQDLEAAPIALPPVSEQERIVAAIEEHLFRLDAAEAALTSVVTRLSRFEDLVYGQALLPSAPRVPLGQVVRTTSGGTPKRTRPDLYGGTVPWIKSGELGDGIVTSTDETITEQAIKESSAKKFPQGTVLIAMYGATIGKLGKVGVKAAATNQAVAAMFPSEDLDPDYLWNVLRALRSDLVRLGKGGAQPNISQSILRELQIPLPPRADQAAANQAIERSISVFRNAVEESRVALSRSTSLRRSILAAAFSGQLVPQDPDDEPASVLLERIRAEREATTPTKRTRKAKAS